MTRLVLRMAVRNIIEHRRKSLTVGIIVGAAAFLFTLGSSVIDTASAGIRRQYRDRVTGDLYIAARTARPLSAFGWKDIGEMATPVPRLYSHASIKAFVSGLPGVESATSRAIGIAQLSSEEGTGKQGIALLMGVSAADYAAAFPEAFRLASGSAWEGRGKGLVLSDFTADTIGREACVEGAKLTLSSAGGSSAIVEASVVATLSQEDSDPLLRLLGYVDIDTLRPLLGYYREDGGSRRSAATTPAAEAAAIDEDELFSGDAVAAGGASGAYPVAGGDLAGLVERIGADRPRLETDPDAWQYIVIKAAPDASIASLRSAIEAFIEREGLEATVYDWLDGAGTIASMILGIKTIFGYIALLVGLVALLIIMNSLVISVTERTAEIGTMRAIGGTRRFVQELIVAETVSLSSLSGLAGLTLGALTVGLLGVAGIRPSNFILKVLLGGDVFKPLLSLPGCAATIVAVLAMGVVASVYPTRIALRVPPSVAMQRE